MILLQMTGLEHLTVMSVLVQDCGIRLVLVQTPNIQTKQHVKLHQKHGSGIYVVAESVIFL